MVEFLSFVLVNLPLLMLAGALAWTWIYWIIGTGDFGESCTRKLLLLGVGFTGIWGFSLNIFFPEIVNQYFDWPLDTFKNRMGAADLAIGVAGITAYWRDYDYCLAVCIISFFFYPGLLIDHIIQLVYYGSPSLGNVDFLISFDLLITAFLISSIYSWSQARGRTND